jgi:hypothetical protein
MIIVLPSRRRGDSWCDIRCACANVGAWETSAVAATEIGFPCSLQVGQEGHDHLDRVLAFDRQRGVGAQGFQGGLNRSEAAERCIIPLNKPNESVSSSGTIMCARER